MHRLDHTADPMLPPSPRNLIEKFEQRIRDLEAKLQAQSDRLESRIIELEAKVAELQASHGE